MERAATAQRLYEPRIVLPLLLAAAAVLSSLLALRGLPLPDEGAMLTQAAKLLRGSVFYRDLDAYPFPAATYTLAAAMAIFGEHFTVARALAALLYCASVMSLYAAALAVLDRRRAALFGLALLVWKPLVWPAFTMLLYSEFAFAWGCAAVALLLRGGLAGSRVRLVLAGVCVGVTVLSKQNLGIYLAAATAVLLLAPTASTGAPALRGRAKLRAAALFAAGAALPVLPFLGWFAVQGLLPELIHSGLLRPFTGYLPASGVPFLPSLAWWRFGALTVTPAPLMYLPILPYQALTSAAGTAGALLTEALGRAVYTSVVAAFAWALWVRFRAGACDPRERAAVLALAVLAVPFALSAWPRADFYHVSSVFPVPALLLFALARLRASRSGRSRLGVATAGVALAACLAAWMLGLQLSQNSERLDLERADLWVRPGDLWMAAAVEGIQAEVPPGGSFFVFGHEATLYFLCDRYFPWPFPQLYPGQTGGGNGEQLARRVAEVDPALVVRGWQATPGLPLIASYAPELQSLLKRRYEIDKQFYERHGAAARPVGARPVMRRRNTR